MKKTLATLSIILIYSSLWAGRIDKAFKALESYDYFGAKELFEKVVNNDIVSAPYGLSLIYSTNNNPFYNLDSAYLYISLADKNYTKLDEKKRAEILKFGIDSIAIENLKDSIDKKAYIQITNSEQITDFNLYLEKHVDSDYKATVMARRNDLAFEEAKTKNTAAAYQLFFLTYPNASEANEAQNRYEEQLFKENTISGNPADFNYFIKKYPESPFVNAAQDSVYVYYSRKKSIDSYYQFIKENPRNNNVDRAWRNIYNLYTSEYSPQRIIEFRIDYPEYPFIEELKLDMKLAAREFLPYQILGKWGFIDRDGNVMIEPRYDYVESFSEGLALAIVDGNIGFIDKSGKEVIPFEYSDGESFKNGYAIVSKNEKYGMIDRTNKLKIPLKYELIGQFNSNLALVANKNYYGYVNKNAEEEIPLELDFADDFENGFAIVEINGKKGIINSVGKLVVPAEYVWLELFNKYNVCRAKKDSLFGLLNKSGGEQLEFVYDQIGAFSDGLAMVASNGKYGYVDRIGEIKVPIQNDYQAEAMVWGKMEDGYTKFFKDSKYGIIDSAGKKVFPALFEDVGRYQSNSLVAVKKRGKWGYSDNNLKLAIPYKYEFAFTFTGKRAIVKSEGFWGIIDEKSNWLVMPSYDEIVRHDTLGFLVKSKNHYGFLGNDLDTLAQVKYKKIDVLNKKELLKLTLDDRILYYDFRVMQAIEPKNN